jgi:hypothetical protein
VKHLTNVFASSTRRRTGKRREFLREDRQWLFDSVKSADEAHLDALRGPSHVYFPITAIVSLLYVMENGASAEIAVVGHEGIVGISLFMGGGSTPSRAVVQSAGYGFRLKAETLKSEFDNAGPVLHLLLRYTQALITQMAQTAVCNRHHSLDQQLCRTLRQLPARLSIGLGGAAITIARIELAHRIHKRQFFFGVSRPRREGSLKLLWERAVPHASMRKPSQKAVES